MPKPNGELSLRELERQDIVDSACFDLIVTFVPLSIDVKWNIEYIGKIRDALQEVLVDDMKLMTEQEFYPYLEPKPEPEEKPDGGMIILNEDQITAQMHDFLIEIDADELARLAGEFFGGNCYFVEGRYHFYPDENYNGAFDFVKKLGPLEYIDKLAGN